MENTALNQGASGGLLTGYVGSGSGNAVFQVAPIHGTVSPFSADGSFTYTPNTGYVGVDTFQYNVNDGISSSRVNYTVTIVVSDLPFTTGLIQRIDGNAGTYTTNTFSTPATTNGAPVGGVRDQYLAGNDLVQATNANRASLITNAINGKNAIHFDGVASWLQCTLTGGSLSGPFTLFLVFRSLNNPSPNGVIFNGQAGEVQFITGFSGTASLFNINDGASGNNCWNWNNKWHIIEIIWDGTSTTFAWDGGEFQPLQPNGGTQVASGLSSTIFGAYGNTGTFLGELDLAFSLLYTGAVGSTDSANLVNFLATHFNLTLPGIDMLTYYPFTNDSTFLFDSSGGSPNLTNNGSVSSTAGVADGGASSDGTGTNYLSASGEPGIIPSQGFTVAVWVKLTTLGNYSILSTLGSGTLANDCFELTYNNDQGYFEGIFTGFINASFGLGATSFGIPSVNTWHLVILWFDPTAPSGQEYGIQVDNGTIDHGDSFGSTPNSPASGLAVLANVIGGNITDGAVSGPLIVNRVWSAAERTKYYNSGAGIAYPF
jgi:hypothetical protein